MRNVSIAVLCFGLWVSASSQVKAMNNHSTKGRAKQERSKSSFRYVILRNEYAGDNVEPRDPYRTVEVLLDETVFSEKTLRKLFDLISRRYPKPQLLRVWVYTNLNQLATPEEEDRGKRSETPDDPDDDKYHWAIFIREDGNELFRYNPDPPSTDLRTVILKGTDPQAPKR